MLLLSVCKAGDRIRVSGPHYIKMPTRFVTAPERFASGRAGVEPRTRGQVPRVIHPRVAENWGNLPQQRRGGNDRCLERGRAQASGETGLKQGTRVGTTRAL